MTESFHTTLVTTSCEVPVTPGPNTLVLVALLELLSLSYSCDFVPEKGDKETRHKDGYCLTATDVSVEHFSPERLPSTHTVCFLSFHLHMVGTAVCSETLKKGTVICGSEQVTACICVKSFDDAELKGLQVL